MVGFQSISKRSHPSMASLFGSFGGVNFRFSIPQHPNQRPVYQTTNRIQVKICFHSMRRKKRKRKERRKKKTEKNTNRNVKFIFPARQIFILVWRLLACGGDNARESLALSVHPLAGTMSLRGGGEGESGEGGKGRSRSEKLKKTLVHEKKRQAESRKEAKRFWWLPAVGMARGKQCVIMIHDRHLDVKLFA